MRNSIYSITLDEALEAVGGHHAYQLRVMGVGGVLGAAVGVTLKAEELRRGKGYLEEFGEGNMRDLDSVLFLGAAIGALLFGLLVNCLGRKKSLLTGCFAMTVSTAATSASVSSALLYLTLPICSCAISGVSLTAVLAMVETSNAHFRVCSPAVFLSTVLTGYSGLGLLAVFLPKWRLMWVICAVVWVCAYLLAEQLLESPCYLAVVRGKYGQARSILQQIAEINQKSKFSDMLEGEKVIGYLEFSQKSDTKKESNPESPRLSFAPITKGITSVSQAENTHISRYFYWHLVWLRSLRRPYLSCTVLWTCLFFASSSLVGVNKEALEYGGALGVVVGLWLLLLLSQRVGRIPALLVAFVVTGLSCLLGSLLLANPCHSTSICNVNKVFSTAVFYTGFIGAGSAQCVLLLYTIELFPSAVRSLSLAAVWACCGVLGSACPVVQYVQFSPVLVSGLSLLFLSPLLCFMKETVGEDQCDYIQEEKEDMKNPADLSQIEVHTLPTSGPTSTNPFSFQPFNEEE